MTTPVSPPPTVGDDARDHWEGVYRSKALDEVSWFEQSADTSLRVIGRVEGPLAARRAVDVGAGTSPLLDALLAEGWGHVTALDVAGTALEVIRRRVGDDARASYVATDLLSWRPTEGYDLWHDRAVLHFLTEAQDRAAYVELAARTVLPGGALVIGGFAPGGPTRCSGLPVARRTAAELVAELDASFAPEHAETRTHHTPSGAPQPFTWVRLRRRPSR